MHKPLSKPTPSPKPAKEVKAGPLPAKESTKGPNATEAEYRALYLAGKDARFEGYICNMRNGHRYVGDWAVFTEGIIREIHETKGGYAFFSQGRAKLAFDQCKTEFPNIKFIWAKKTKKGWVVK